MPIERAPALQDRPADSGARAATARRRVATTTVSFISPHVDDQTQSVLVKGTVAQSGRRAARRAVRARAHRLEDRRRAGRAGHRRAARQRPVLRVRRRGRRRQARSRSSAPIKVGPIVGDNYPVLDGLKAGERVVVSGVQKLADGAPIAARRRRARSRTPSPTLRPDLNRVRRHLHQASDSRERLLARHHPRRARSRSRRCRSRSFPSWRRRRCW